MVKKATVHLKDATCHNCSKKGHITKVCRSAKQEHPSNVKKRKKRTGTMNVVNSESEDSDSDLPVLKISGRLTHPIKVKLGKPVEMEVDAGAAVSIISEETYKRLFPNLNLKEAPIGLKTYTGERIPILGEIKIQ